MDIFKQNYRHCFSQKRFVFSLTSALLFLIASLCINFFAGRYATMIASSSVTDLILSHIPVFDVDGFFVYGALVLVSSIFFLCVLYPHKAPYIVKTISLFVVVRSIFIVLTHIGPFPNEVAISSSLISRFSFGADLFFSGHTGLPFLIALLFWDNRNIRALYIGASILFAIVVLLGHIHYSIDVFAAFFITDGIYRLSQIFFKREYERFLTVPVML